jgi:DNA (cytosine-5)-methyltransferase 1
METSRLAEQGFLPGEAFNIVKDEENQLLLLEVHLFGTYRVSYKTRKLKTGTYKVPVIDINNAELADFFGAAERARVHLSEGRISVAIHHEEAAMVEREQRLAVNVSNGEIETGTLCAGAGISTAAIHDGLAQTGLASRTNWMIDKEERYLEIALRNNHALKPHTHLVSGGLEEVEPHLLKKVDLLNMSLPCDIHSKAGKAVKDIAIAEDDDTITCVFGFMNILRAVNPAIVVSENVVEARNSAVYKMITAELRRRNYVVSEAILDETHGGCIEARRRYWFVAVSRGLAHIDLNNLPLPDMPYKTVGDILDAPGWEYTPELKEYAYLAEKERKDIAAGKGFRQNLVTEADAKLGVMGKGYSKGRGTEPRLSGSDGKSRLFSVDEANRARLIPEHLLGDCGFTIGHEAGGQSILYGHGTGIGKLIGQNIR